MKIVYAAAAALVNADQKILLAQRPAGKAMAGLWEFPGGKIEPNETPEAALQRELKEELNIDVSNKSMRPLSFASHFYESFYLFMPLYKIQNWLGKPEACEGQSLAWVAVNELHHYPAPEADIPLFDFLMRHMKEMT